ncbi:MAG: hypothetical protein AAF580_01780 [Pseudomonadota bacterium]
MQCAGAAHTPSFASPLDCTLGEACFIQTYVDTDPSGGLPIFAANGSALTNTTEPPRFQAQAMRSAGRRPTGGAAPGTYRLRYQIVRSEKVVDEATSTHNSPQEAQ